MSVDDDIALLPRDTQLSQFKENIFKSTERIRRAATTCPHYLTRCECLFTIKSEANYVLSIAYQMEPYLIEPSEVEHLKQCAYDLACDVGTGEMGLNVFCVAANSLRVDSEQPIRKGRWLSDFWLSLPGKLGILFRRRPRS